MRIRITLTGGRPGGSDMAAAAEHRRKTLLPFCITLLSAAWLQVVTSPGAMGLEPRAPGAKMSLGQMRAMPQSGNVVVKFREGSGIRLRGGRLIGLRGADAARFVNILSETRVATNAIERLHTRPEGELNSEREAAQRESGRELADLNLYYVIRMPAGASAAELAARLNGLRSVEFAEPGPRPAPLPIDIPPVSPKLTAYQGYKKAPPQGIGALNPNKVPGGDGKGVPFVDIEYSWQLNHEDLELPASANIDTGATLSDPFSDTNHGTAVLGEVVGKKNAYGVTGIAPRSKAYVAPANTTQFGYNPARAIGIATAKLRRGQVMIIEQQYWACGGNQFGPLEVLQSVFDAIAIATAKGIVVVAAAGNGGINLDSQACGGLFDRTVRDSWAIIVGAGSSTDHSRLNFSSYGSRVDVQGWGQAVATTGYGDAFNPGDIRQRYTNTFSGTSSATPIVAGTILAIQGALKAAGIPLAKPKAMRKTLVKTGTPQSNPGTGHIGPLPRTKAALNKLDGAGMSAQDTVAMR